MLTKVLYVLVSSQMHIRHFGNWRMGLFFSPHDSSVILILYVISRTHVQIILSVECNISNISGLLLRMQMIARLSSYDGK